MKNSYPEQSTLIGKMIYLVPGAAGAGAGALVNLALRSKDVADQFWRGAHVDALSAPSPGWINCAAIAAALSVWVAAAYALRRNGGMAEALRQTAAAFAPALSILVMVAMVSYEVFPAIIVFVRHAVVLSVAGLAGILAFQAAARRPHDTLATRQGRLKATAVVWTSAGAYWAVFSTMGILQYYSLRISYTDTADWEQMLWNTLRGRFLATSAFDHMFFGEHVQFIQLALLPLYWLAPSLITLMIAKSAVLASGAFPVYLLAKRRLGSEAAGACFAVAYLLYPAMQYTDLELAANTFRPVVFAIPALLWAVYFLETRHMGGLIAAAAVALATKEEMALPVAMLGVLLIIDKRRVWGAAFFSVGLLWFLVSVLWVIPHFRGEPTHMTKYYLDFGDSASVAGIVIHILKHPFHALAVCFRPLKIDYLLLLMAPLALRPLFSWRMLLVMLPSLGTTLLASREPSFTINYHYQASLVPLLLAGAVYGSENCAGFVSGLGFLGRVLDQDARKRAAVAGFAVLVLTASLAGNVLYAKSPISLLFYNSDIKTTYWRNMYVPGERARVFFEEVRPLVPPEASVSASEFAATYFAARQEDYAYPEGVGEVEYVVLDIREWWFDKAIDPPGYERIYEKEGFIVYRKAVTAETDKVL